MTRTAPETRFKRKAHVDKRECVACGCCAPSCPRGAITIYRGLYATVDHTLCVGCGLCQNACPADVITLKEALQ